MKTSKICHKSTLFYYALKYVTLWRKLHIYIFAFKVVNSLKYFKIWCKIQKEQSCVFRWPWMYVAVSYSFLIMVLSLYKNHIFDWKATKYAILLKLSRKILIIFKFLKNSIFKKPKIIFGDGLEVCYSF